MRRKYELGRRADSQGETRQKIVEATVYLHERLGPRRTTISAIAAQAGVQRLTVYRHFPNDAALFAACSSHWLALHPLPDATIWRAIAQWRPRCRAAFAAVYAYYRRNHGMLASVLRDADMSVMQGPMQPFVGFFSELREDLLQAAGPTLRESTAFSATIAHVMAFSTWQSLEGGLTDTELVDVVMAWVEGIAARETRADRRTLAAAAAR